MLRLAENYGKNYYFQLMQNANCKPKWRSPVVIILKYISECCLATVSKEIGFSIQNAEKCVLTFPYTFHKFTSNI